MKNIKHKIIVMSNKGGVGKSTVSINLACGLAKAGNNVGLFDADLHGPSMAKMLGVEGQKVEFKNGKIHPIILDSRIKLMSMACVLSSPDDPVIWRGPLKMKAIKQFVEDVEWGELDYLIIDSPPGTGDEPLSLIQLIPGIDGAVIVTTPQAVALLDSRKAVNFIKELKVCVLGVIENMSGFICPHCGKETDLFKKGGGKQAAIEMEVPFLGSIPFEGEIVNAGDEGKPYILLSNKKSPAIEAMQNIVLEIISKTK